MGSKITSRINAMDLLDKLSEICKSSKDIKLLESIFKSMDKRNINITNQGKKNINGLRPDIIIIDDIL